MADTTLTEDTLKLNNGEFCWIDLSTPDPDKAKPFYQKIFGWEYKDDPIPKGGVYTLISVQGKAAGGLYKISPEQEKQNVPPHWLNYVKVENTDQIVSKAKELGAKIVLDPLDVMDAGRMAVIADPTGAHFAVWQSKNQPGVQIWNGAHGSFCWSELMTRDIDAGGSFYSNLLGWSPKVMDMASGPYTMFNLGEKPAAGMFEIKKEMGEIPPHWAVYFAVENYDKAASTIQSEGGKLLMDPIEAPGVGKFVTALDPTGAAFAVIQMAKK